MKIFISEDIAISIINIIFELIENNNNKKFDCQNHFSIN